MPRTRLGVLAGPGRSDRFVRGVQSPTRAGIVHAHAESLEARLLFATFVVTNTLDSGAGSLRSAITSANSAAGADTINFNITAGTGVRTITPATPLPAVTGPTTIDGYSQAGSSANTSNTSGNAILLIELNGSNIPAASGVGLQITGGGTTVRGLVIDRFPLAQIIVGSLDGTGTAPGGNVIQGNYIGTDSTGTARADRADGLGDHTIGIQVAGSTNNTVGGTNPANTNVISGNGTRPDVVDPTKPFRATGLLLMNAANNNIVQGNRIGVASRVSQSGVQYPLLGNSHEGIGIYASTGNLIGALSTSPGMPGAAVGGNIIGGNGRGGVWVYNSPAGAAAAVGNQIVGNAIFQNAQLGIDLGAVPSDPLLVGDDRTGTTLNDAGDGDTGANGLQNFPVLSSAVTGAGGSVIVTGSVNTIPDAQLTVSIYTNPTNERQGRTHVQDFSVTADSNGNAPFTATLPAVGGERYVTATVSAAVVIGATASANTSEFSAVVVVPAVQAQVNDGSVQRSRVTALTVVFAQPVTLDPDAIALSGQNGAGAGITADVTNPNGDGRTWLLGFSGATVVGGSLTDGIYDLTVVASKVHGAGALTSDYTLTFHRLFGDIDGNKTVNNADSFKFSKTYLKTSTDPAFLSAFDYNGDGMINNTDNFQFNKRYLMQLLY